MLQGKDSPYVVIHGGVHKTATSYLQSILQRNAGKLRKHGVHYVHHRDTRKNYTYPCQLNGYLKLNLGYRTKMPDHKLADVAEAFFHKIPAQPGDRIILSDENMQGHCGHCIGSGLLYVRRETLLPIFSEYIPYPVREVHIAVRNYADFFASAYVEYLRSARGDSVIDEIAFKRNVISRVPSWSAYLELVAHCFTNARIHVWKHEDFHILAEQIVSNICGSVHMTELVAPKRKQQRPSASHKAVQEMLDLIQSDGAEYALAKRVEIQKKYPRGDRYPGYDPWTEQERAHLMRLYERDVTQIKAMDRVQFLTAPSHAASSV